MKNKLVLFYSDYRDDKRLTHMYMFMFENEDKVHYYDILSGNNHTITERNYVTWIESFSDRIEVCGDE